MRLYGYLDEADVARVGVLSGSRVYPLEALVRRWGLDDETSYERLGGITEQHLAEVAAALERAVAGGETGVDPGHLRPAPAVGRFVSKIVCVGLNYRDHAAEGGREAPARPLLFAKFENALVADDQPVIRPEGTHALDLEVELGVVIGRTASRVSRAAAMDHVAGYVVVNDISARDWQGVPQALRPDEKGDGQWLRAKGSDTFLPMGPVFVTADAVDPAAGLRLRSWRITPDGREHLMQDGSTADMIWGVPALIELISAAITLQPGDVIATGTPSGVGVFRDPPVFLEPGDRVRCEVEGIGRVENPIVDWSDEPATEA
jgi:2-keto-4-pentenoate hydratase/2-oxohepta-3-ene-1,7-dioic acid hydratase in catechol pathway